MGDDFNVAMNILNNGRLTHCLHDTNDKMLFISGVCYGFKVSANILNNGRLMYC